MLYSRAAAMVPVREITREISRNAVSGQQNHEDSKKKTISKQTVSSPIEQVKKIDTGKTKIRPVNENDFKEALKKVKRTGEAAQSFLQRENSSGNITRSNRGNGYVNLMQALQLMNMMTQQNNDGDEKKDEVEKEVDDDESEIPSIN